MLFNVIKKKKKCFDNLICLFVLHTEKNDFISIIFFTFHLRSSTCQDAFPDIEVESNKHQNNASQITVRMCVGSN